MSLEGDISKLNINLGFITSNENKFKEAKKVLEKFNIDLRIIKESLIEIQDDNLENVSKFSLEFAKKKYSGQYLVEDSGLFIKSLNGFPGPYSAYIYRKIGCEGILKLINDANRIAEFRSAISFTRTNGDQVYTFIGVVKGRITFEKKGDKGFGFDPIFMPKNYENTFAEMPIEEKNKISHRGLALKKFAEWYVSYISS